MFYGTHPAIIEQEVFDKVQEIRQQRHRRTRTGKSSLFSGPGLLRRLRGEDAVRHHQLL